MSSASLVLVAMPLWSLLERREKALPLRGGGCLTSFCTFSGGVAGGRYRAVLTGICTRDLSVYPGGRVLAPARKLSPLTVLERESCSYLMGRPVRVVRVSSGLKDDVDVLDGTRVEAMDMLSSSAWYWDGIVAIVDRLWWIDGMKLHSFLTTIGGCW